ncbi:hypothetical protein A6V39_00870 [Candidatus Mycoplasma haematobovis]|uniref:Uncharacterized protein n=1 Tax=Candidatus Mycoplasma haematobovis TaxID=432608 RepID=A0A1A9QEP2_9MOLU|nr:hypothetical protein [Candidatus Mycoplasma haematobovis]OAL10604.1 hypothetical protein A6V39_00870 [Candidatus Mycoplasma haematobovis]
MKTGVAISVIGAGLGTLGGGGLLVNHFFLRSSVIDVLTGKGHTFLSFEKDGDLATWKTIAKAYHSSTKNRLGDLKVTLAEGDQSTTDQSAKDLRKACKEVIDSKGYTDATLLSAEQWCVKPITIKELIGKHRKVLSLDINTDENQPEWNKKVEDYLRDGAKNKIPSTTLTARTENNNTKENRKKLKTDCNTLTGKKTHDANFHENYSQFNEWCTVSK